MGKIGATALFTSVFTAVVVSAFWIWFYNVVPSERGERVCAAAMSWRGGSACRAHRPVAASRGRPGGARASGVGIKPDQLTDTFTQARGQGRTHDAIDIMASKGLR
jgi:hypothetical protein